MPGRRRNRQDSLLTGPTTGATKIYRRFLYLDADQVLSSLSGLGIGRVEQVLETSMQGRSGDFRVGFAASMLSVGIGRAGAREITQQLTRRQTIHSAVNTLLSTLTESDGLVQLRAPSNLVLTENSLVEFDADISLVPIRTDKEREAGALMSNADRRIRWDRLIRRSQAVKESEPDTLISIADHRTRWDRLIRRSQAVVAVQRLLARNEDLNRIGLAAPCLTGQDDGRTQRMVLLLQSRYLLMSDPRDFTRRATVVAQVEVVAREDEEIVLRGNTGYDVVPWNEPKEGENAEEEVIVRCGSSEQQRHPEYQIVLRPLCIFK